MAEAVRYDGESESSLASLLGVPRVMLASSLPSTMDAAHALAADGASAGTIVLADAQERGRGRSGKSWVSGAGEGIWLTLIERPADAGSLEVLSLRIGIAAAATLDEFVEAPASVRLKWPNDLMTPSGKLGGVLVEVRWRSSRPEWVAIGIGINVTQPQGIDSAASLGASASRVQVLRRLVPAMRHAASLRGALTPNELSAFDRRDWARGREALAPGHGIVRGITASGALVLERHGARQTFASGSLILEE